MTYSSNRLYSAKQIREAEALAYADYAINSLQLMRQAGQAVFDELRRRWPDAGSLTVCCGCGNNGGDGYVVAALAKQAGLQVRVQAVGDVTQLRNDALTVSREFVALGGRIEDASGDFEGCDVIVDAMLGTGLNRAVDDDHARMITAINAAPCPVLAVDVPSGLHADTGCVMGSAVKADVCVSFIALKSGLFTGQGAEYCGAIVLADLDFPSAALNHFVPVARLLGSLPRLPRRSLAAHKGDFGHLLVVGGNLGYSGAIRLAAETALRAGAGLVSIATRPEHAALLNIGRAELMCHGIADASQLVPLLARATAVVIGPGLGQDAWAQSLLQAVIDTQLPCVVDADGLNLLAQKPQARDNWLLTPHPGEAARLLGSVTSEINADRYTAVNQLQQRYNAVCILKGAGSLIAEGQRIDVNCSGNPGMASGGMGDVLAGLCGALIAQGLALGETARLATFYHAQAADLAAAEGGERGLLASDLIPLIRMQLNR